VMAMASVLSPAMGRSSRELFAQDTEGGDRRIKGGVGSLAADREANVVHECAEGRDKFVRR
jgi:hypothetical protein